MADSKGEFIRRYRQADAVSYDYNPGGRACGRAVINNDGDLCFIAVQGQGSERPQIHGFNLLTQRPFRKYVGGQAGVEDLDVDKRSEYLLSVNFSNSNDPNVYVHDIKTGAVVKTYCCDDMKYFTCCSWVQGSSGRAVVGSEKKGKDGKGIQAMVKWLRVLSEESKLEAKHSFQFPDSIKAIITTSDLVFVCADDKGKLWKVNIDIFETLEKKRVRHDLPHILVADQEQLNKNFGENAVVFVNAHREPVENITIAPSGKFFVTASHDQCAYAWDLDMHRLAKYDHSYWVSCAAISPIGPHVFLASTYEKSKVATQGSSTDGVFTVQLHHLVFGDVQGSFGLCHSPINWVGLTPDGMTLVVTAEEGILKIVRLGSKYFERVETDQKRLDDAFGKGE